MISFIKNYYLSIKNYCLAAEDDKLQVKVQQNSLIGLPRFPYITAFLVFLIIGSKVLGNSVSIVLMILIVLLDPKWWLVYIFKSAITKHPLRLLFIIVILCTGISVYTSLDFSLSLNRFLTTLAILWIAIGSFEILSQLDYRRWLPWLVKIFVVYSVIGFMHLSFNNINVEAPGVMVYVGWTTVCILPILIFSIQFNINRWLALTVATLILLSAILIESRSTLVGYSLIIITFVFIHFRHKARKMKYLIILSIVVLLLLLITVGYPNKFDFFHGSGGYIFAPTWLIDPVRQATWNFLWNIIPSIPFFGYGLDASNLIEGANDIIIAIIPQTRVFVSVLADSPHNVLLQWLVELGWISFIAIIMAYLLLLIRLLIERRKLFKYTIMLHAGYFGISLMNSNFWLPFWLISYFVSLAVLSALIVSVNKYSSKCLVK